MKFFKIAFLLISCIFFFEDINAQSPSDLDAKNGFKNFTLGDSYVKWSSYLRYSNSDNDLKYYDYTGSDCKQVFEYSLEKIRLGFKNDKLQVIYLITTKQSNSSWQTGQYNNLKNSFNQLFGRGTESSLNPNSGNVICGWVGKKVLLTLEYEYLGVQQSGDDVYTASRCNILVGLTPDLKSGF